MSNGQSREQKNKRNKKIKKKREEFMFPGLNAM